MEFIAEFPHNYVLDVVPGWPESNEPVVLFPPNSPLGIASSEFQDIRVYPRDGESWLARFESNTGGSFAQVLSTPNPSHACVIFGGSGYWVDTENRTARNLDVRLPITNAVASTKHKLIVFTTWTDVIAYRSAETAFHLRHIFTDRLRIVGLKDDVLTVAGFLNGEDDLPFHIGLRDGQILPGKTK